MCLEGTGGEQWSFQPGPRMRRSLIPVIPVCTSSSPALHQHRHCLYLGVKKQRGGSQVLLLEGTHGVCHLPLLHPAGQQHRGLHTSQAAPHSHSGLKLHTGLFSYTNVFHPLLLDTTDSDAQLPRRKHWKNMNTNPFLWAVIFLAFRLMTKKTFCSCSAVVVCKPLLL